ncbi:hypothetical protein F0562_010046 [Nyssa sinensis]|uniref:KIB1-4 beta-propeller domain-containing protein n=1 Tax=Nyssa sinensis TaxID=561372 RepID=A0A5J4ZXR8_9ASTE|nr:hypothetical protein F0562_010046 [Nyssa sinensis]
MFNISTNKTYKIDIPQLRDRWCCASTNGWLLTIGLNSPNEIHLLNPFSKSQIQLPPRSTFQEPQLDDETYTEGYLKRVITSSSNPYYDPDYIVFVIHCNKHKMAFCKPGDQKWTTLEAPRTTYSDAIFFRGEFYATDGRGNVLHCELNPNPRATQIAPPPIAPFFLDEKYLVESAGEFLMVRRSIEWEESDDEEEITDSNSEYYISNYKTVLFEVFKLDLSKKEWSKVKSLGDEALFLGHNQAIAVSTRNSSRCRANCIYFTDSNWEGYFRNIRGCCDMVLKKAQSTGKKAELWPYVPYNLVAHPYVAQIYDKKAPPGYVRVTEDTAIATLSTVEEQYNTMFSDENPNACSIM